MGVGGKKVTPGMRVVVWLEWPERCFRVNARQLKYLGGLLPKTATLVRVQSERAFLRELKEATHALVWNFRPEWFALAPKLQVLATPAAGRELVPTEAPLGVRVHFGGFHGEIIAETVLGFVLAWAHGFFARCAASSAWPRAELAGQVRTVKGTRAVILGYGRIGRAIGAKLSEQGVEVVGISRHGPDTLATRGEVLRTCDWLVLALPSDTGTDDLVDARLIAKLPRRCVLVNVGRGNAVDEQALVGALAKGRLAGAYLDVCKREPTALREVAGGLNAPSGSALASRGLGQLPPSLVVMPHSSAFAPDYLERCFKELKDEGYF